MRPSLSRKAAMRDAGLQGMQRRIARAGIAEQQRIGLAAGKPAHTVVWPNVGHAGGRRQSGISGDAAEPAGVEQQARVNLARRQREGSALEPARRRCLLDLRQRARTFAIWSLVGEREGADRDVSRSVSTPSRSPTKRAVPGAIALGGVPRGGVPWPFGTRLTPTGTATR